VRSKLILIALVILAVLSILAGVAIGPVYISPSQIWTLLWREPGPRPGSAPQLGLDDKLAALIIRQIRLPRVLLGFLVGLSLSLSGSVMQGLFRNPLASPYVLGVASGASAGAAAVIALGFSGPVALPLGAFLGGALAVAIVCRLARVEGGRSSDFGLILGGVALGAVFSAGTSFLIFLTAGDRRLSEILF